jgi:altronate dehydratase large subunit
MPPVRAAKPARSPTCSSPSNAGTPTRRRASSATRWPDGSRRRSTIEEKALGAIAKGGAQAIHGVLSAAEPPPAPGLYLMDTPFFSPESITAMVAAGAQLVAFTTGAGNSYCSALAPTFKMSANRDACARLREQIDFAAAAVLEGEASFDAAAANALDALLAVASGTLTYGEIVGEGAEVVSRLAPSL